ncbi:MAG: divalent-cation tolerance protein CutA [Magnetospiraceae bacterium]
MVYVTAANREEARAIAATVVAEKLAACANILGETTSVFRWQGKIQEETEVALILKTRQANVAALTVRICDLHSYECPCVVALPLQGGNPAFLTWIGQETSGSAGS